MIFFSPEGWQQVSWITTDRKADLLGLLMIPVATVKSFSSSNHVIGIAEVVLGRFFSLKFMSKEYRDNAFRPRNKGSKTASDPSAIRPSKSIEQPKEYKDDSWRVGQGGRRMDGEKKRVIAALGQFAFCSVVPLGGFDRRKVLKRDEEYFKASID
ncbi:hypothetical protein K435DRAFT_796610 [Dendrothele bispora CBS 962.96]|uniref:Uncharacterized protein n=1 Tax=Dendrothele bispora (strain CBS 962.96) TaxID=1314807 RepID=A0A4S8M6B4_DENBC|nr:hypothetical protein K435DRAFT_796610 [Dendrothele bispora CBS 962.96]